MLFGEGGDGSQEPPKNRFTEVGGGKVVDVEVICHDFKSEKALFCS